VSQLHNDEWMNSETISRLYSQVERDVDVERSGDVIQFSHISKHFTPI